MADENGSEAAVVPSSPAGNGSEETPAGNGPEETPAGNGPEESTDPPTELEEKIIRQTEYYFGDLNLPRDKFLQQQIKEDDGWVTLETMTKFNRLNQLSSDIKVLAAALRKSMSGLLEVHEDNEKIRRCPDKPLPELNKERRDDLRRRSIYTKGFPEDSSLDTLMEFFEKFGKVEQIQMRRTREKDFKGSCFVVYAKADDAKEFLEGEASSKYGETELVRYLKDEYFRRKAEEKKSSKQDEMKKKNEAKDKQKKDEVDKNSDLGDRITKGAVLHLDGIPAETTREDLKAVFADNTHTVAWVEFDRGDTEGKMRFQGENSGVEVFKKLEEESDGKITVKGHEVQCRLVEGDEELEYWRSVFQSQRDRMNQKRRGGGRGRGGWGGRGGHRDRGYKRRTEGGGGEPSAKVAKE